MKHEQRGDRCHTCSKSCCEIVPWPCIVEQNEGRGRDAEFWRLIQEGYSYQEASRRADLVR